ncbi:molybdopterin dinucleotide binding domain-containing protein, partial [Streptomyces sp. CBMA29]|uniref:molybdopterin dinucleotide binding domain-containing protein n=1 Tax=Streptomyces sp. CBMA29 TaxID=1896314 RepID=UPI002948B783
EVRDRWPDGGPSYGLPTWFYGHEPPNAFASGIAKFFANATREGRLQDGDDALAGTRHAAVARLSAATAAEAGVTDGDPLTVTGPAGAVTLPLVVTAMPDRVVWLPLNSAGNGVASDTGARTGQVVSVGSAAEATQEEGTR